MFTRLLTILVLLSFSLVPVLGGQEVHFEDDHCNESIESEKSHEHVTAELKNVEKPCTDGCHDESDCHQGSCSCLSTIAASVKTVSFQTPLLGINTISRFLTHMYYPPYLDKALRPPRLS